MSTADDKRDANLDAMLADWPAPERSDSDWEDFESKLSDRVAGLSAGNGDDAWFDAPLPAESGESGAQPQAAAGDVSMSGSEPEKPKKKSFKEIAQRVSVVPSLPSADSGPSSGPVSKPASTPLPRDGNGRGPLASRPSFTSKPPEARDSDSGLLDLNAVRKSATSIPDTGAMPGTSGIFDDEVEKAAPVAAIAARPKAKSSALPIIGGGLVAFAAIAAAAMLFIKQGDAPADMSTAEAPAAAPMATAAAENAAKAMPAAPAEATPESLAVASAPAPADAPGREGSGTDTDKSKADDEGSKAAAKPESKKDEATGDSKKEPTNPDDLAGAMAGAVGAAKDEDAAKDKPSGPAVDPSSIPESPSQGAIQGALGSVMGAAKSCVAGMDAPSRASITFASSGAATRVSVSGPASGKPAGSCIQSALKGARVGPFKRSSFTVGVTIRP